MEKLDLKAIWIFFLRFLGIGLILILSFGWYFFVSFSMSSNTIKIHFNWWATIILIIIWILVSYGWAKLYYNSYKFELADEAFKRERGVIWKKYTSIPYERIQNIDIYRGLLDRILGLSDLEIQTAGYSASGAMRPEGRLIALSKERAEEIQEELLKRAKGTQLGL